LTLIYFILVIYRISALTLNSVVVLTYQFMVARGTMTMHIFLRLLRWAISIWLKDFAVHYAYTANVFVLSRSRDASRSKFLALSHC